MGSYFGKYRGIVKDNIDPDEDGRIRAIVPEIASSVMLDWALPCIPYGATIYENTENDTDDSKGGFGFFAVPEIESGVWIEFESGDINRPIWVGTFFSTPAVDGVPRSNVPWEARDKTNPDTGLTDYPVEKVLKTERLRLGGTRRIVLELDQDAQLTEPWTDATNVPTADIKTEYQMPKIEIGKRGVTDEDKADGLDDKNIFDIGTSSRDLTIDTERDQITNAERDIHHRAGINQTGTDPSLATDVGDVSHTAENQIENVAYGTASINSDTDTPGEVYTNHSPNGKMRLSAGLVSLEDTSLKYDVAHKADPITLKLSSSTYTKIEALLYDVIIKSGSDTYIQTDNGLVVEATGATTTPGADSTAKATNLHYLNSAKPSDGSPYTSHEVGKPSADIDGNSTGFSGPSQDTSVTSPTRYFLKYIDERSIKPYNEHHHEVVVEVPEFDCDDCDDGGGGGGSGVTPGDVFYWNDDHNDYTVTDTTGQGDNTFDDGAMSQLQSLSGTADPITDPNSGDQIMGAVDVLANMVNFTLDALSHLTGFGGDIPGMADEIFQLSIGTGAGMNSNFDNTKLLVFDSIYDSANTFTGTSKVKTHQIAGPDFSNFNPSKGPMVKTTLRAYFPGGGVQHYPDATQLSQQSTAQTATAIGRRSNNLDSTLRTPRHQQSQIQTGTYFGLGMVPLNEKEYIGGGASNPDSSVANFISFPVENLRDPAFMNLNNSQGQLPQLPPRRTIDRGTSGGAYFSTSGGVCGTTPGYEYGAGASGSNCVVAYTSNVNTSDRWAPEWPDSRVGSSGHNNGATVSGTTGPHKVSTEYAQAN